jgi:hypothetical protein
MDATPLDLDVIDAAGLKDNVHNLRHSAFNLNRMMVEDIREIIVYGRRARHRRGRLLCTGSNMFSFMTTPHRVKAGRIDV